MLNDPLLQALMALNRQPEQLGQQQPMQKAGTYVDPIAQALAKLGIYQHPQLLSNFTPAPITGPFPVNIEGKFYDLPHGMRPELLNSIFQQLTGQGLRQGGVRGLRDPASEKTFEYERPGPIAEQALPDDAAMVHNMLKTAIDSKDAMMIDFLIRNYPELFKEEVRMQNSGLPQPTGFGGR